LLEILLFVSMHVRPSNSPHVIAVTHPPRSTPSASESYMLKWLNRAGTRSESFGLCWFTPATTTHRAMMDAVKGLQPREERATLVLVLVLVEKQAWRSKMQLQLFSSQLLISMPPDCCSFEAQETSKLRILPLAQLDKVRGSR
jgi:hypothetical protein